MRLAPGGQGASDSNFRVTPSRYSPTPPAPQSPSPSGRFPSTARSSFQRYNVAGSVAAPRLPSHSSPPDATRPTQPSPLIHPRIADPRAVRFFRLPPVQGSHLILNPPSRPRRPRLPAPSSRRFRRTRWGTPETALSLPAPWFPPPLTPP